MKTSLWRRGVARTVLVTFTSSVLVYGHALGETPPTPPGESPPPLSKQELRDLVAPVALYPDVVLSSLLPATTFPDQLHDAAEFVGQAEQVDNVPTDRGWDGGVVGLLQFPDVVRWLDSNPAWTAQMGEAVTYQQGDVLDAIQDYRREVANAGNLKSNQYQKVRVVPDRDIVIEPARPDIVYVPSYDPALATQPQPAQVVQESPGINPWLAFGGGAVVGALGAWALYSIFDDDDDDRGGYYGRRRIRGYDNYYYARGRRPRAAVWMPRPRPYRDRPQGWQRPQRLRYASPSQKAARRAALRPPMTRATAQAPPAARLRQQQRQERQEIQTQQRQERRQVQQQRRQQKQQVQRQQRQEKQGQRQEQRQRKQVQPQLKQQRQEQRREQRQVRQGQRQQQRQQKQVHRQQRSQQTQAGGGGRNANPNAKRKKGQGKNR
jgi:Protein of unknown function (DUF3300)